MMEEYYAAEIQYVEGADILKALGHPIRLHLVNLLLKEGKANVKTLHTKLDLPQSTVSLHLAKLRYHNLVKGTRSGLEMYYEIADERISKIIKSIG
ncbi:ArsR/SmtB family transcription factor [Ectobacillus ponti]|uniref:Metalloregulator ArsR/SmtB family transcription factor n=1 Tax=Ectobacillus ponti TaxID=2961894 RepID=A0AA41X2I5_9BACI|nr:metalloregulator ArsR/SmtB family transcription factor [Ectobacillus ponti]MCP8967724.1 metalloregulator ArsR/SmtB family transcription factor [Ectobacillus ponti]